jgi:hypothetical protein
MVHRILRAMFAAGLFDYPESLAPVNTGADVDEYAFLQRPFESKP